MNTVKHGLKEQKLDHVGEFKGLFSIELDPLAWFNFSRTMDMSTSVVSHNGRHSIAPTLAWCSKPLALKRNSPSR